MLVCGSSEIESGRKKETKKNNYTIDYESFIFIFIDVIFTHIIFILQLTTQIPLQI